MENNTKQRSKKKIWIIIISTLLFILMGLPAIAFCIVKWGILPPEKLTPLVVREANKVLNGELECERIELTFFETYPRLGVRIYGGTLVSYAAKDSASLVDLSPQPSDTLLTFNRALISVNPLDYFFNNQITIGGAFLEEPYLYAYVNEAGKANWDLLLTEEEIEENAEEEDSEPLPPIDLQRLRVKDGYLVYDDRQSGMYAEIDSLSIRLKGGLITEGNKIELEVETSSILYEDRPSEMYSEVKDLKGKLKGLIKADGSGMKVEMGTSSILFESPAYTLTNKLALNFKGIVVLRDYYNTIRLKDAEMMVNTLPFTADGVIKNLPDSSKMRIDMDLALQASDLNELLAFVPDEYFRNRKNTEAKGTVLLESSIHGFLADSITPTIDLCCKIDNGSYFVKGVKQGIDELNLDMDVHLNGEYPDSSYVVLENLSINGLNTSFSLKGKVNDLFQSPDIEATMKGRIDFTRLAEEFLNPDTLLLRGKMDADITASFALDDLLDGRYNRVNAAGKLDIDQFRAFSKPSDLGLYIAGAHFSVDSSKQTSSFLTNEDLLTAYLTIDSMSVRYKKEINTRLSQVDIQAKTSPVIDTTAVIPLTTHIKVGHLRTRMPDSVWVVATNSYLRGGIKPSDSDKSKPNFAGAITIDTLRYIDAPLRTGVVLAGSTFGIEAMPYRDAMRRRMQSNQLTQRDSTRQRTQRTQAGGPGRQDRQRQARRDSTETSTSFLRNWEVKGTVKFNQMRLFSRLFPLRMNMEQTTVRFDTNTLTFTGANFHAGKSDFTLTGELNSMRRAVLAGGKLQGNFSIHSDYIDCNELIQAMNRGMLYLEEMAVKENSSDFEADTLTDMDEDTLQASMIEEMPDTTETLFVVPAMLDMTLKTTADKIDFKDVILEHVNGELVVRNQSINLKQLSMDSNIGSGNLTMVYTAKDRLKANAGFELDMAHILVDELIDLFPAIDSLLPMLRSFEGVVDCQMTATCDLDSTMAVDLPTLHSACYLNGVNMVLLDGETFSEISKTLMFKNKQRNLIDSISVDLVIRDTKIEVYPFLIEMDRYRVAVGGTHNLDMSFDYHLSVLKSPVPFKLGIDVTGNIDKFKYKIVKCRYKDIFKPAREAELDETRTNLRKEIREAIQKEMLANAPELARDLQFEDNFSNRRQNDPTRRERRERPRVEEDEENVSEE